MKLKKQAILFICLIIALGLLLLLNTLRKPQTATLPRTSQITMESIKLQFLPGEEFFVTLNLDSKDKEVAAADIVVYFNPQFLKVLEVKTGKFFTNYPINTTYRDHIKLSGIASFNGESLTFPKGKATLGQIKFQAQNRSGNTIISFDSRKTIVATSGQDILDKTQLNKLAISIQ